MSVNSLQSIRKTLVLCILMAQLFLGLSHPAQAQFSQTTTASAGVYNPLDMTAVSARAAALGSAFTGVADDPSALLFNPAGLSSLDRDEIILFSELGWAETFQGTGLFGAKLDRGIGMGFAGSYHSSGSLEGRDGVGSLTSSYGADRMFLQAGLGMDLFPELSIGASLRGVRQSVAGNTEAFFTPDLGILFQPFKDFKLGLDYAAAGIGPSSISVVSMVKAGMSWTAPLDPSTKILAAMGAVLQLDSTNYAQVGVEISHQSKYFFRLGYQSSLENNAYEGFSGFTFGAGFTLAGFVLDYAFLPYGDLGNSHRFSVTYPFGGAAKGSSSSGLSGNEAAGKANGMIESEKENKTKGKVEPISGLNEKTPGGISNNSSVLGEKLPMERVKTTDGVSPVTTLIRETTIIGEAPKPEMPDTPKDSLTVRFKIPADFVAQGDVSQAQGRYPEAIGLYQEALKQNPANVQAWWSLGSLYGKLKQKPRAIQCLEKVLQLSPSQKALRDWLEKYKNQ